MTLHVLHVAAECAPFAKVGGLGDVVSALPRWTQRIPGFETSVLLPWYGHLGAAGAEMVMRDSVTVSGRRLDWGLWRAASRVADFPLFLVEHEVFREDGIYGPHPLERQALLGAAAREIVAGASPADEWSPRAPRTLPVVGVVHAHDHHAALASLWLRGRVPVIATVHNARYHGDHAWSDVEGLVPSDVSRGDCDHAGRFDSLKAAVLAASLVTTVSPTHAKELTSQPQSSNGLDYAFRMIGDKLVGILNGIDTIAWDPATDLALAAPFSAEDVSGKARNKLALCQMHGLDPAAPLLASVGRLVPEKGVDALLDLPAQLAARGSDAQLLVLGAGEPRYEERLRQLESEHPRVKAALRHDEALAHLVYAGADVLVMPSWHEPCGLAQMYAMRYGTVPVVNPTGGLRDSVAPFDETTGRGTGFWMERSDGPALADAAMRALDAWRRPDAWRVVQQNGMRADLSCATSAQRYVECYRRVTS